MRQPPRPAILPLAIVLAFVLSACGSTAGHISAPAAMSASSPQPTLDLLPERIATAIPPIDPDSFAGNWEGRDSDDGSKVTLAIVQIDDSLTGIFRDWYTGAAMQPGFQGNGAGAARSATTGKMTFYLSHPNGLVVTMKASLTLSNKGTTLTFIFSGDNPTLLHRR